MLLLLILPFTACDRNDEPPLRIAHISWPGYEALSLAHSKDLYKNIKVRIFRPPNIPAAMLAFENNIVDVLAVALNDALLIQSRQKEALLIFAVLDISDGGDVIIASKDIKTMKDLKGKRVAMEPTGLGAYFISKAVDSSADVSLNQLHIVPAAVDQHEDLFLTKKVDAVVSYGPVTSSMIKNGGHIIFDSRQTPNEIVDVLITKKSFASQNPTALTELLNGYFSALEVIKNRPTDSIAEMADYEGLMADEYNKLLDGIRIPDKNENRQLLGQGDNSLLKTIGEIHHFSVSHKIFSHYDKEKLQISNKFIASEN